MSLLLETDTDCFPLEALPRDILTVIIAKLHTGQRGMLALSSRAFLDFANTLKSSRGMKFWTGPAQKFYASLSVCEENTICKFFRKWSARQYILAWEENKMIHAGRHSTTFPIRSAKRGLFDGNSDFGHFYIGWRRGYAQQVLKHLAGIKGMILEVSQFENFPLDRVSQFIHWYGLQGLTACICVIPAHKIKTTRPEKIRALNLLFLDLAGIQSVHCKNLVKFAIATGDYQFLRECREKLQVRDFTDKEDHLLYDLARVPFTLDKGKNLEILKGLVSIGYTFSDCEWLFIDIHWPFPAEEMCDFINWDFASVTRGKDYFIVGEDHLERYIETLGPSGYDTTRMEKYWHCQDASEAYYFLRTCDTSQHFPTPEGPSANLGVLYGVLQRFWRYLSNTAYAVENNVRVPVERAFARHATDSDWNQYEIHLG